MPNERTTRFETVAGAARAAPSAPGAAAHVPVKTNPIARFIAEQRVPIGLLLFAAVVRLVAVVLHRGSPIDMDGAEYVRMATNLAHGVGLVGIRGFPTTELSPLFPLLIATLIWFVHDGYAAAVAINVVAGVAYVGLVYAVTRLLYREAAARVAAVIGAVLPLLVQLSIEPLSEIPFGVAMLTGLWGLLRFVRSLRSADAAICAAGFGAAYLTRPEGSLLLALGFTIVALAARGTLRAPAVFAAIALAFVVPYAAATVHVTGHVALESKTAVNFAISRGMLSGASYLAVADAVDEGGRPTGPEIAPDYYDPRLHRPSVPFPERLALMARAAVRHAHDLALTFGARECGFGIVIVLAIVGLTRCAWPSARRRDELILFAFVATLYLAFATVLHFWTRYAVAFLPFAVIWAARGVVELHHWSRRSRLPDVGFALLGLLVVGSLVVNVAEARPYDAPVERAAGTWIARHGPARARVVDVADRVAFYAGGTWAPLPYGSERGSLRYLTAVAPDFVVLDDKRAADYPLLARWFAAGPPARVLQLVYRVGDGTRRTLRVYRWLAPPPLGGPSLPPPARRSS